MKPIRIIFPLAVCLLALCGCGSYNQGSTPGRAQPAAGAIERRLTAIENEISQLRQSLDELYRRRAELAEPLDPALKREMEKRKHDVQQPGKVDPGLNADIKRRGDNLKASQADLNHAKEQTEDQQRKLKPFNPNDSN